MRSVDVIVPVYGAAEVLGPCLESVTACTDLVRHRLLLVIDGPQSGDVEAIVAKYPQAIVMRNDERRGFVHSVNRGMNASRNDVVLLNSDTIVTPRWLDKLIDAAMSAPNVGTVTPLSNHATLVSVPRSFEENLIPNGYDARSFLELIERVSTRTYPRLPTAVGVCMYIKRELLNGVGFFDEEHFGFGYGEENDFCMRATRKNWVHVADDATFIAHVGHRSFGASRKELQRTAARTLSRLHPQYMTLIARFMKDDPLREVRERIERELIAPRAGKRIVHVVHGWPPFQHAGTELYAHWLVRRQAEKHHVSVYTRSADAHREDGEAIEWIDRGVRVRFIVNHFRARDPLRRNALRDRMLERDFERFLKSEKPDLVHIHHLAGHAFSLARVAKRLRIPIVLQIQDWWFVCARVNQFDFEGKRCSGPGFAKCVRCATLTNLPPRGITNRMMHLLRRRVARKAIEACDAYVVGSKAIRDDYVRAGFIARSESVKVIPYGVAIGTAGEDARHHMGRRKSDPIRFGYVGSIAPHKGVHTAVEAMRGIAPGEATLHLWGDATALPEYVRTMQRDGVVFEGRFDEGDKPRVFASMDVLLVPSIGLESFGLAAREAMASGVPVIASAGGALAEMFEPGTCGDFFPAGDAEALRTLLRRAIDEPSLIETWSRKLPQPKRDDVHAEEIERVYESVLRR